MIHPPIKPLLAAIAERAEVAERGRRLPEDLVNALRASGVFLLTVPKKYGGFQAPVQDLIDTITAVSAADGATGWVTNIAATTAITSASMPEEFAAEIWSDPAVATCGVTAPMGRAIDNGDGTATINGRWQWASGSSFADWLAGGTIIDGSPEPRLMFFDRSQFEVLDTWHASGLRGTASNDFEVVDAIVPLGRSAGPSDRPAIDAPLYAFPLLGLLALGVSAVGLGIARRAIDELIDLAGGKVPTGSKRTLGARANVQRQVAEAEAAVRSAQAYMADVVGRSWDNAVAGNLPDADARNELRLVATNATLRSAEAVDLMYHAAGGSAVFNDCPLQRCFRDVHVVTQHLMVAQPTLEVVGRHLVGIGSGSSLGNDGRDDTSSRATPELQPPTEPEPSPSLPQRTRQTDSSNEPDQAATAAKSPAAQPARGTKPAARSGTKAPAPKKAAAKKTAAKTTATKRSSPNDAPTAAPLPKRNSKNARDPDS